MAKWLVVRAWVVDAETAGDAVTQGEDDEHFRTSAIRLEGAHEFLPPSFDVVLQPPGTLP